MVHRVPISPFVITGNIMPMKALWKLNGVLVFFLLTACGYAVSVNDNIVYTPPSIFSDYRIADKNLADCIQQTIVDREVTSARDLKRLDCSNAGINSLAGLEIFVGIEELNLAENNLQSLDELKQLTQLRVLILSNNSLTSIAPLLSLLKLQSLDVAGNSRLGCEDLAQLEQNWAELSLTLPARLVKPVQCG